MSPLISLIGYLKWLTNYPYNRKTPLTLFKLRYCSLNSICGASDIQFSSVQDILKSSLDSRGPLWHYGVSLLTREITSVSVLLSQYSLKWNNFSPQETGGLIQYQAGILTHLTIAWICVAITAQKQCLLKEVLCVSQFKLFLIIGTKNPFRLIYRNCVLSALFFQ